MKRQYLGLRTCCQQQVTGTAINNTNVVVRVKSTRKPLHQVVAVKPEQRQRICTRSYHRSIKKHTHKESNVSRRLQVS